MCATDIDSTIRLSDGDLELAAIDLDTLIRVNSEAGVTRVLADQRVRLAIKAKSSGERPWYSR